MKKVLVTGAGGFIGSHVVEELLKENIEVRALIRPGESLTNLRGMEIERVEGDVLDTGAVLKAMAGVDTVFHLAALIGIPFSSHLDKHLSPRAQAPGNTCKNRPVIEYPVKCSIREHNVELFREREVPRINQHEREIGIFPVRKMISGKLDHIRRTVHSRYVPARKAAGDLCGHLPVPASDIDDRFLSAKMQLPDQLPGPSVR